MRQAFCRGVTHDRVFVPSMVFLLALFVFTWGCSTPKTTISDAGEVGDAGDICPQTVAERCAEGDPPAGQFGVHCALTLAAAEQDSAFCTSIPRPDQMNCGVYTVVRSTNVDFSYLYYYDAGGALVAITSNGLVLGQRCLAGDATFRIPASACGAGTPLSVCNATDAG